MVEIGCLMYHAPEVAPSCVLIVSSRGLIKLNYNVRSGGFHTSSTLRAHNLLNQDHRAHFLHVANILILQRFRHGAGEGT